MPLRGAFLLCLFAEPFLPLRGAFLLGPCAEPFGFASSRSLFTLPLRGAFRFWSLRGAILEGEKVVFGHLGNVGTYAPFYGALVPLRSPLAQARPKTLFPPHSQARPKTLFPPLTYPRQKKIALRLLEVCCVNN